MSGCLHRRVASSLFGEALRVQGQDTSGFGIYGLVVVTGESGTGIYNICSPLEIS